MPDAALPLRDGPAARSGVTAGVVDMGLEIIAE
jgi:hypothetical protein